MLVIGLMSGTSMDGIDAALVETDGEKEIKYIDGFSLSYHPCFKKLLKAAEYACQIYIARFKKQNQHNCLEKINKEDLLKTIKNTYVDTINDYLKKQGLDSTIIYNIINYLPSKDEKSLPSFEQVVQHFTELNETAIRALLKKQNLDISQIDLIGAHGQTLCHQPYYGLTLQVINSEYLANKLGVIVIDDFRSNDVLHGGQGAPFAPLYHQACLIKRNISSAVFVNCGGIANVSIIMGKNDEDIKGGFDTGPGNKLIDEFVFKWTNGQEVMDKDGQYGSQGHVNLNALNLLFEKSILNVNENYFTKKPPKSLDSQDIQLIPEWFSLFPFSLLEKENIKSLQNGCATLAAFTAKTIVDSVAFFPCAIPKHWILGGGGWNNACLLSYLKEMLKQTLGNEIKVMTADNFGLNSTYMEAEIFAWMAVRSLKSLPLSIPQTTAAPYPLSGGKIHFPFGKKVIL